MLTELFSFTSFGTHASAAAWMTGVSVVMLLAPGAAAWIYDWRQNKRASAPLRAAEPEWPDIRAA